MLLGYSLVALVAGCNTDLVALFTVLVLSWGMLGLLWSHVAMQILLHGVCALLGYSRVALVMG